jgi:hypothetical protein
MTLRDEAGGNKALVPTGDGIRGLAGVLTGRPRILRGGPGSARPGRGRLRYRVFSRYFPESKAGNGR